MKHMKVTKKSNAQFAISAGLSALMVCSTLGVAPVMAVADPAPRSAVKDFSKIAQQVQTYDAAKLHPDATQEQLDKLYPTTAQSKITVKDVKNMKAKLDQEQKVIDGNKLAQPGGSLEQVTKEKNQASHDLHEKYKALEKAENELQKAKSVDYLADLDQDAPQELKDKALAGYNKAVEAAEKGVVSAKDEIAKATKILQQKQLLQITVQIDALKSELATKVPDSTKLSNYEKWLTGKKAELEKLKTIDLGDFSEEYLMIPREEAEQTQTWEALNKKTDEVKNRIKTLEQKIKNVKDNQDYKSITEQIKDLETQQAHLKKELSISGRLSLGEVLGGLSADDILNNALNKDVIEAIKKNLASTYSHSNNTENPGSDQTPAPDNSGDSTTSDGSDSTSMSKEKAQATKTPKTGDFLAALLPMLGVALGGTSIAFGKRMRH
ncbi:hypothetical protein ABVC47_05950 [Fannyhessea vaginae]|uniref:hypothetical protein n=1 Tax=Fannyhessea vaginae TaxID=82135 RepID=UPI00336A08E1